MIIVLISIIFIFNLILLDKRVKAVTGKWPEFHFLINLIFSILMLTAIELELATYVLKITDNISINLHPQGIFLFSILLLVLSKVVKKAKACGSAALVSTLTVLAGSVPVYVIITSLSIMLGPINSERERIGLKSIFLLNTLILLTSEVVTPEWISSVVLVLILIKMVFYVYNFKPKENGFEYVTVLILSDFMFLVPATSELLGTETGKIIGLLFSLLGLFSLFTTYFRLSGKLNLINGLPVVCLITVGTFLSLGETSLLMLMFLWTLVAMSEEDFDIKKSSAVGKVASLILLMVAAGAPFTPGGWTLYYLFSGFAESSGSLIYLLPFVMILIILLFKLIDIIHTRFKEQPLVERANFVELFQLTSTLGIMGLIYYWTIPDIFTDDYAYVFHEKLKMKALAESKNGWKIKNIWFFGSILFPLLTAGVLYLFKTKSILNKKTWERFVLNVRSNVYARMSFVESGVVIKSYKSTLNWRDYIELTFVGTLMFPLLYCMEVLNNLGWWLSRIRPKGINSNLLYGVITTALILIFYIRIIL